MPSSSPVSASITPNAVMHGTWTATQLLTYQSYGCGVVFGTPIPPETADIEDLSPLITPVDAEFRVGTMGLGWDSEAQTVVVELLAVSETEFDASVVLDDAEEGPDAVRVFLSPESAREFATRSNRVISAGRPPCPLCDEPLDPVVDAVPRGPGSDRQATTLFLWISSPQHRA